MKAHAYVFLMGSVYPQRHYLADKDLNNLNEKVAGEELHSGLDIECFF